MGYNVYMKKKLQHMWQTYTLLIMAVLVIGSILYYLGDQHALNSMQIRNVTPNQLSLAMNNDDFFSSFRHDTVIFYGHVNSVYKSNGQEVASIDTTTKYKLGCIVKVNQVIPGKSYHFISEAYRASRQTNGVLLYNCTTE